MISKNVKTCNQQGPGTPGFVCSLKAGHPGEVHVALGSGHFVLEVWEEVLVTKRENKALFYRGAL